MSKFNQPLFNPGQILATRGIIEMLEMGKFTMDAMFHCLLRHLTGDWGNVPAEDAAENELAVTHGLRVMSSYELEGVTIWIITEWDRSVTTILLPDEY